MKLLMGRSFLAGKVMVSPREFAKEGVTNIKMSNER